MRRSKRIDYKTLHLTGAKVFKCSSSQIPSDTESEQSEVSVLDQSLGDSVYESAAETDSKLLADFNEISTRLSSVCIEGSRTFSQNSVNEKNVQINKLTDEVNRNNSNSQTVDQTLVLETFSVSSIHETGPHQKGKINSNLSEDTLNFVQYTAEKMSVRQAADLLAAQQTVAEDIDDYIEENPLEDASLSEIDSSISKMEELRRSYRTNNNVYKSISDEYLENDEYESRLSNVKKYILLGKQFKKQVKQNEAKLETQRESAEKLSQKRTSDFVTSEISKMSNRLKKIFDLTYCDDLTDDHISQLKNELPENLKQVESISKLIKDLLSCNKVCNEDQITKITKDYDILCFIRDKFVKFINNEVSERELSKKQLFNEGKLKINVPKFSGYESKLDIYTFQSEFMKSHERTTPKRLMADMLKNNFLDGAALSLVSSLDNVDEIWERLKSAYGDAKLLLKKKLGDVEKINLWKIRDPERIANMLSKLINTMRDLTRLAEEHEIEARLYSGDGIEKIYNLMGDTRLTKWLSEITEVKLSDKQLWFKLIEFLEKDLKVQQQKLLIQQKFDSSIVKSSPKTDNRSDRYNSSHLAFKDDHINCKFCGEKGHVTTTGPNGTKIIQYFVCKKFAEMNPNERFFALREKGYCIQCLFPGASQNKGKHEKGHCQHDFTCQHSSHAQYSIKKHVLVCHEHRNTMENEKLLESYKQRCIIRQNADLPSFSKEIKLSFHTSYNNNGDQSDQSDEENAIYMLQTIAVDSKYYSIFYDTGCSEMVSRYEAITSIGAKATLEQPGPITLGGVGNSEVTSEHGIYQVRLPLYNGKIAKLSGVCMEQITAKFPVYPLQGEVENDIKMYYKDGKRDMKLLPNLPKSVGGHTDFMIGIKYYRYYPELIFQLPSGLAIYKSMFLNPDGSRGVVGGPHKVFTEINTKYNDPKSFITSQYKIFRYGYQVNTDISLLHFKDNKDFLTDVKFDNKTDSLSDNDNINPSIKNSFIIKSQKKFDMVENAGSEITYRCSKCRNCKDCKHHENIENLSVREEIEQSLINKSVTVDVTQRITVASLPFIHDPLIKLANNKETALRVYNQQLKKLEKDPKDKDDIIKSEATLQSMNFVGYVKNLPFEDQEMLEKSPVKYYIPWRVVWNGNSISTPCRLVFDGSQGTSTGYSLNDVLAKGTNNMNRLLDVVIRWCSHFIGFHTDIKKMYNSVHLRKQDWCYQRYIWHEELDRKKLPVEKVIKTVIYGIKPSGNQAERGIRETARLSKDQFPEINRIVQEDIYVDDCLSGSASEEEAFKRADDLEFVLNRGGFSLKGVTFSRKAPPYSLSSDGQSINVAGMRWYPLQDELSLDVDELNFSKKVRGKKSVKSLNIIPKVLTRRHCVSKVAEIFDITGKITPITATMKLDLHELVLRQLDWDDAVPDDLRLIWLSHFEMMKEISSLRFKRAIVPDDAVSMDVETLDFGDASNKICCVAIYARFLKKDGTYSSQLVFSRSKIIPDNTSQPRAELLAATVNTHTGEVVRRSFGELHKKHIKITDSQIVLYWIHNESRPLKQWVRNRVVEIRRFTNPNDWKYTQSKSMLADIGTRRINDLTLVDKHSVWINGFSWMKGDENLFPFKSIDQVKLNHHEISELKGESLVSHENDFGDFQTSYNNEVSIQAIESTQCFQSKLVSCNVPEEVRKCYEFSRYLLNPNKLRFKTVVRIMALVIKFIKLLKNKRSNNLNETNAKLITLSDEEIKEGKNYYFMKATEEVKKFLKLKDYENISQEKENILLYTGRILPTESINVISQMSNVMKDLTAVTFCVPLVYKHSPIAYSIVNEIHWFSAHAKHSGIETIWRFILKEAFIIGGRELVKKFKFNCNRCRFLRKRTIDVQMGPASIHNLTIAPAFYASQVDLTGPFKAYDAATKRKTSKIWLTVFCCATTSTVNLKVMDDYSTTAFILSFTRFACEVGYPKTLLIDDGSQLVKGCESMKLNFIDLKNKLHRDVGIEFQVCPVGGHNVNGKVERRIRHVKESLQKTVNNDRLSLLQWETLIAQIANTINDLPLALGNIISDYENMDLLTPNRLRLGRNNERSPVFPMDVSDPKRIIQDNSKIFNVWFQVWLVSHVPKLMDRPKWYNSDRDMKICDVVIFLKQEGSLAKTYQYGMIQEISICKDGLVRKVLVKYRNHNENIDRFTWRSVRQLVIIHPVDELSLMEELAAIANYVDVIRKNLMD